VVVLGGEAFSYERGTPVTVRPTRARKHAQIGVLVVYSLFASLGVWPEDISFCLNHSGFHCRGPLPYTSITQGFTVAPPSRSLTLDACSSLIARGTLSLPYFCHEHLSNLEVRLKSFLQLAYKDCASTHVKQGQHNLLVAAIHSALNCRPA